MKKLNKKDFWLFAGMLLLLMFLFSSMKQASENKEVTPTEFQSYIAKKEIDNLEFISGSISGSLKTPAGPVKKVFAKPVTQSEFEQIRKKSEENGVVYRAGADNRLLWSVVGFFLQMLLWMALLIWILGGQMRSAGLFSKSRARSYRKGGNPVTFADVAGCDEAKEELRDVVEFLKNPREFSRLGGRIPKGVLLVGNPGTGKTLLAQAAAGEAGVEFLFASGSEFIELFAGIGAARVRDLFENARKSAPCIVFIDEIDGIGGKRNMSFGHGEHNQTIDELLKQLDGFQKNTGVIVIGATNRLEVLDEALIRPGRFDRHIEVPLPDVGGREAILKIHAKNVEMSPDADFLEVAKNTGGLAGADLANVINEAALIATKAGKKCVEQSDLTEAVDKVTSGPARKSIRLTPEQKKRIACHESGHTLVARLLKDEGANPVHKVTIIPRGQSLGHTRFLPEGDVHLYTQKQLEAMILVSAGGRAAEEAVFGEVTTGACNDFENITKILRKMVCEFGMSEAGMVVYEERANALGQPLGLNASEKTKENLELIIENKLEELYKKAKLLLEENREKLDALAKALLEKETLDAKEIDEAINSV